MISTENVPAHVPANRVVDFDVYQPPLIEQDYFAAWQALQAPGNPALVWTPHNGGHWIATRGEDIHRLWADAASLSNEVLTVPPEVGKVMRFIPLQLDPPEHGPFRKAVMTGFASRHIVAMEPQVRAVARELIAGLQDRETCDFMTDFAEILPINIFLTLIDVPLADRPMLREFGTQLTRPDGTMMPAELMQAADDYLWPFVQARLANPGNDLFSRILAVPIDGRAWTQDEARRMCRNLLFGGLDTVVAMLGFVMLHLARHPAQQQALRDDPKLIPDAADELMRRYASVSVSRNLRVDMDLDGVTMKAGDTIYLASVLHNLDERSFDAPHDVRFDRKLSPLKHTTMGNGSHRCVGAALARMEIITVLQEWLPAIPLVRLDPAHPVTMRAGNVGACTALPLRWDS